MSNVHTEVRLLCDYTHGEPRFEAVPALQVGENRYRITASPGLAPGVAAGDEIEWVASDPLQFRVVRRGGNVCVQLFLRTCDAHARARISDALKSIGGWLDGGMDSPGGHLLIYTIPVSTGFDVIANAMDSVTATFDVDRWHYGNVYDTNDGVTPLNWWLRTDAHDG